MAERIAYLEAVVGADITQFRKSMRDVRSDVGVLSDTIGGISGAARTMTFAFTAPLVALGTYAVQAASSFDASMRNINSIAHLPEAQLRTLSERVLDFGKNTRSGTQAAADALYEVYSAGIEGDKAFELMAVSTKMAEAGLSDLSQTTNALTATVMAFSSQNLTAAHASDIWTAMVQQGVGSMSDFLANSQKVMPLANMLGLSFENVGANAAYMSQQGGGAKKAMTSLAMAMSNIIKPNETMKESFQKLGVTTGKELIAKFGTLEVAIQALKKVAGNDVDFAAMFSKTGLEYATTVANNVDSVTESVKKFHGIIDGATESAWEQQMKSFAAIWDKLQVALSAVAIVIGQKIIPIITPLIEGFTRTLLAITDINPEIIAMGVAFTGAIAAAAPIIWLLTSMLNPVGLVIGAVGGIGVAFATNFMGARDTVNRVVKEILGDVQPLIDTFNNFWEKVFPPPPTDASGLFDKPLHIQSDDVIVIDKPTSLWDLYKSKNYDKMFSWDEFMKKAKEGGWTGKALNIGDKIILPDNNKMGLAAKGLDLVAGALKNVYAHYQNQNKTYDPTTGKMVEQQETFWNRLADAAAEAWPKLKVQLDLIWGNIKTWVTGTAIPELDKFGGSILGSIAGWFNPTNRDGKTEAYTAVKDMVGGGAAKGITDGVSKLEERFPAIAAGLRAMVDAMGSWIQTEGLPTVARSIGYFVGSIGATIGQLLGSLGQSITGGEAGKAADGLIKGINDSVLTPALGGMNDAMKDHGIKNGTDGFFTGLAGILVAGAGISVFGQMLAGKGFVGAVLSTIKTVLSNGLSLAGAVVSGGAGVMGKVANAFLNTSLGASLANTFTTVGQQIMGGISSGLETAALNAMVGWDKVVAAIGGQLAVAATAASAAWTSVSTAIGAGLKAAMIAITPATTWVVAAVAPVATAIGGAVSAAIALLPALPVVLAGLAIVGLLSVILPADVKEKFSTLFNEVFGSSFGNQNLKPLDKPVQVDVDKVNLTIQQSVLDGSYISVYDQITGYFETANQNNAPTDKEIKTEAEISKLLVKFKSGAIEQSDFETKVTDLINGNLTVVNNNAGQTKSDYEVYVPIKAKPVDDTKAKKMADDLLNPVWTQIGISVAAQTATGNYDTTTLASGMAQPFVDEFALHFGTTGDVTTNWQSFITTFDTGTTDFTAKLAQMTGSIGVWSVAAVVGNALVNTSFNVYNGIKDKLAAVNTEAKKLADTLAFLVAHSPYEITVNIKTNGEMPTLPAGAQGGDGTAGKTGAVGIENIPYDNYLLRAHQGERLLDKQEAHDYRNMPAIMGSIIRNNRNNGGGGNTQQNVVVNVYGAQDADGLLRELDRRGYKLEKR